LRALAALPALAAPSVSAVDAGEPFADLDRRSAALEQRLDALVRALPSARAFVDSARADLQRHARERAALALARGWRTPSPPPAAVEVDRPRSLPLLKAAFEDLMHAVAESLPSGRGDKELVERLARQMIDLSRLATVVDLWIEQEGGGD
jgi:hypothetical protein